MTRLEQANQSPESPHLAFDGIRRTIFGQQGAARNRVIGVLAAIGIIAGGAAAYLGAPKGPTRARAAFNIPGCDDVNSIYDSTLKCCPVEEYPGAPITFVGQCTSSGDLVNVKSEGAITMTGELTPSGMMLRPNSNAGISWNGNPVPGNPNRIALDLEKKNGDYVTVRLPITASGIPDQHIANVDLDNNNVATIETTSTPLTLTNTGHSEDSADINTFPLPHNSTTNVDLASLTGTSIPKNEDGRTASYQQPGCSSSP